MALGERSSPIKRVTIAACALLFCVAGAAFSVLRLIGSERQSAGVNSVSQLPGAVEASAQAAADLATAQYLGVLRTGDYHEAWRDLWQPVGFMYRMSPGDSSWLKKSAKPLLGWRSYKTIQTVAHRSVQSDALVRVSVIDAHGRALQCWFVLLQSRGKYKVLGFGFPPMEPYSQYLR